jgi:hypothetical protein
MEKKKEGREVGGREEGRETINIYIDI